MSLSVTEISTEPLVRTEVREHVGTLTLNRPVKLNPLSREMIAVLQSALEAMNADPEVRVVIIAGAGRAFSAGHDLREMRSMSDRAEHRALFDQCGRMMQTITGMPKPVIAQVRGIATAAGCQLVAACDLAVAASSARFAVSGINVGLFCSTPSVPLSRNLGRKRALEMLLTGDFIDADTALAWGLVNRVVEPEAVESAARALAARIASKSRGAVELGLRTFYRQVEMSLEEAYAFASERMACNMDSDDAREGIDAFLEKRSPRWNGE